jgi:hypothetical protein
VTHQRPLYPYAYKCGRQTSPTLPSRPLRGNPPRPPHPAAQLRTLYAARAPAMEPAPLWAAALDALDAALAAAAAVLTPLAAASRGPRYSARYSHETATARSL